MINKNLIIKLLFLILALSHQAFSQESDTIKTEKERKNLRFSILGGPGYTPDFGFLIGGSALFTFSTNKEDSTLKRSVMPIAFAYLTAGGGSIIIRPQLFMKHDRIRLFGKVSMNSTIDNYYGIGYERNSEVERHEDSTEYRNTGFKINPILLFRFKETDLFFGGSLDIAQKTMNDPSLGVQNDPYFIADGGDSTGLTYFNSGIGLNISYDTRDIPANSYKGILLELGATLYSKAFGGSHNFGVYDFQYKQYKELKFIGERKVLAWMLTARLTSGDIPISEYSMIGSAFDLRGYYLGQYRDRNAITSLVEYRHMFNAGDRTKFLRILSKFGFVAWGGVGTIDPDFVDWSGFMPNYGAGIRIEVQPRMNFRIDFGRDPLNGQTLMYFNMTEAF